METCFLCGWALRPGDESAHQKCSAKRQGLADSGICVRCGVRDACAGECRCAECGSDENAPYRGYSEVY